MIYTDTISSLDQQLNVDLQSVLEDLLIRANKQFPTSPQQITTADAQGDEIWQCLLQNHVN